MLTLLPQYQRESLARKVFGVSEVAACESRVPSGTTLLWLIEHLAYAERLWIMHRFVCVLVIVADHQDPRWRARRLAQASWLGR